jgi:hypothetical protein
MPYFVSADDVTMVQRFNGTAVLGTEESLTHTAVHTAAVQQTFLYIVIEAIFEKCLTPCASRPEGSCLMKKPEVENFVSGSL